MTQSILSVDDSAIIRRIIGGTVDVLGYDFKEAVNGAEALKVLESHYQDISLILLDWNMPVMDGYSALTHIRSDSRFQHIPVVMVTTEGEKEKIVMALRAGANEYLCKPFSQEDLMARMVECMAAAV